MTLQRYVATARLSSLMMRVKHLKMLACRPGMAHAYPLGARTEKRAISSRSRQGRDHNNGGVHMRITWKAALAAAAVAIAGPALATNGMRMTGFGAVQNGMGGVGVGATLDASAAVSNPAGLTELGRRLDVSFTWFQPSVDYTATGIAPPFVNQPGAKLSSDRGGSPIPNLGAVVPLPAGFTAGLGAFGVGGMGVDYKSNLYSGATLTSYQNMRVAPAIAWKANDMLSVGLAVNLMWAQMKYAVASGFGQQAHDSANAFGYGATLGVKLTPVKDLAFGLAYESKSFFGNFEFDVTGGKDVLDFDQPAVISGGVAYRAAPALLLALDVQWINWSDTNGKNKPVYKTNSSGAIPWNMGWDDQVVLKVGAAFDVTPAVTVRAGYNYGKMPLDAARAFESIAFPAIAEHHIALGLGWAVTPAVSLNAGLTYSPEAKLSGTNASPPPAGQGLASYETKMSQIAGDVGLGWKF